MKLHDLQNNRVPTGRDLAVVGHPSSASKHHSCSYDKDEASRAEGFLMRNKSTASFAIIRYNLRTYEPGGVMAIIKGCGKAEATVEDFEGQQSREDQFAGWGYFLEKTDLRPGMDPQKATSLRQTRLDVRESKAQVLTMVNRRG